MVHLDYMTSFVNKYLKEFFNAIQSQNWSVNEMDYNNSKIGQWLKLLHTTQFFVFVIFLYICCSMTYQTMWKREGISEEHLKDASPAVAFLLQGKPQISHVLEIKNYKPYFYPQKKER